MTIYAQSASSAEWSAGQEERLRLATRAAGLGIWEWNLQTNDMIYDARAREIMGLPANGPVTIDMVRALTHPDDVLLTRAQSARALDPAQRSRERYTYRLKPRENGEIRWVDAHAEAVFDGEGPDAKALRYIGTVQDVTNELNLQRKLAEDEARLKLAMDAGGIAVWELDMATGEVTSSPELNRMFGFPEDAKPTADDYRSRYAPGEQARMEQLGAEARAAGRTKIHVDFQCVWPDGSTHWLLMDAQVAPGQPNQNGRVIGTLVDITDRKRDQERLELLAREMRHRVKNTLSIVQSLAAQSLKPGMELGEARKLFESRLKALSNGTDLLFVDEHETVMLDVLTQRVLTPFWNEHNPFVLNVVPEEMPAPMVVPISLILHELATNALKYGALSVPEGRIDVDWLRNENGLEMTWREENGPAVDQPEHSGFGTRLLKHLSQSLGGSSALDFEADGFTFRMTILHPSATV